MDFGNLAGGLAQGLGSGLNMRNQLVQQQNEQRRMAILEQGATLDQQLKQAQVDKQKGEASAYDELAKLVEKYAGPAPAAGGEAAPANADPQQRITYGLHRQPNLMRDPNFLNEAAATFIRNKLPEGIKWLETAHAAAKDNRIEGYQRILSGDLAGAAQVMGARGITPVIGANNQPTGQFQVTLPDGSQQMLDPKAAYRATLSPSDFFKTQREEEELAAKKELWGAQREYYLDRNQATRDVADTRADAQTEAAALRLGAGGGAGRGSGAGGRGGGGGNQAKWMDDFEKTLPTRDVLDDKGKPVTYMKAGNIETKQEVDKTLARPMRDMARVNAEILEAAGMAPAEAADTFSEVATTLRDKKPAEAYETLRQSRGLVFARDDQGNAKRVAIQVGTFPDGRPILAKFTPEQEKVMLAEDKRRQLETPKAKQGYRQEEERMLNRFPTPRGTPPASGGTSGAATPRRPQRGATGDYGRPAAAGGIK